MAKPKETFGKKEQTKKKLQKRQEKEERKLERKSNSQKGKELQEMFAYVDEHGNLSSRPALPGSKPAARAEGADHWQYNSKDGDTAIRVGVLEYFDTAKGYGFIRDTASKERIFVHSTALLSPVELADRVSFVVQRSPRGLTATDVKLVKDTETK